MPKRSLDKKSIWDVPSILSAFDSSGIKERHAVALWSFLLRHPDASPSDIPDFPKAALTVLGESFHRSTSFITSRKDSSRGDTTKLLLSLHDGMQVEAVIMKYEKERSLHPSEDEDDDIMSATTSQRTTRDGGSEVKHLPSRKSHKRSTLCVSSQVGCQMECTFCSTGTMGLKGDLSCGEIIEQLLHARSITDIRNVVFMGMGEPLNNYEAVRYAVRMMTDPRFFGLGKQQVTISTVGVIPRIRSLTNDLPGVGLALSLHAPTQELREQIVPSAKAYKLTKLMDAVLDFERRSGQRVFVEYVMLADVNDGEEVAHQLGTLLKEHNVLLNLIPWNPVYSPSSPHFSAPTRESVLRFQGIMRSNYAIMTTIRQEKGQDISGACGQLVIQQMAPSGVMMPHASSGDSRGLKATSSDSDAVESGSYAVDTPKTLDDIEDLGYRS
ncbi:hypothetical protein CEUSTIGMA_g1417.t1 [Chlamydomonas eustigma]|uniref:Radical SAM core domain-containing protein n=1 Tax=Chlamydomonas eustigma TaxID=1157962 RepID=A0A250WT03_9CHLO|nr:hypothetical protein CEUSTIGMA_g1417.t1 [Chlamydomonas eustigma]|eukprot:GAX73967.1 hypothetical protein CEUSTIGMA_g1417.t1 [Chlamydomonas eustigma]